MQGILADAVDGAFEEIQYKLDNYWRGHWVTHPAQCNLHGLPVDVVTTLTGSGFTFAGGTVSEVLAQRMMRTPTPVTTQRPELPAWVARLVDKLLKLRVFGDAASLQLAPTVAYGSEESPADLPAEGTRRIALFGVGLALSGRARLAQRTRAFLARLLLSDPDLLLLDEPTNHLDLPTCEALEEALANFPGAVVLVSHDRYYLSRVTNRIVELNRVYPGGCLRVEGDYPAFLERRADFNAPFRERIGIRQSHSAQAKLEAVGARDITRRSLIVIPTRDGQSHFSRLACMG